MKHIVTLSLVFFSLTHLAKAERIDGLRLITEKYCNKQQVNTEQVSVNLNQPDESRHPYFLTYNELTSLGVLSEIYTTKYRTDNQIISDLIIREKPKNNSP